MPKKAATAQREEITVEGIFGPGGLLEKRHPGYEFRPSQLAMAQIAAEAFREAPARRDRGRHGHR